MQFSAQIRRSKHWARASAVLAALAFCGPAAAGQEPYGWRGYHVGVFGNYSFVGQDIKFTAPTVVSGSADLGGPGITGLVGYRIPIGNESTRIGIELDGSVGDNRATFNRYRFVSDFLVTLRGTLGYHFRPDLVGFVTAGVGWMGINSSSAALRAGEVVGGGLTLVDRRHAETVFGGVVGVGLEWDMGRAIHLRGDYLYGAFESHRADLQIAIKTVSSDVHQLRLGLVYSLQNPYDEPHGRGDIDHDRYARGGPLK